MTLSRRTFLFSAAAAGFDLCRAGAVPKGEPALKFGVLSDSHVTDAPETAECLRRIFGYFSRQGVDAVLHAGDICHLGNTDEFKLVVDAWRGAFPGGRNAAGGPVVPFFVFGNHDYHKASFQRGKAPDDAEKAKMILNNRDAVWRDLTGEPFPGEVFAKEIKGRLFVGAHWGHEGEIADWFKANPVDPSKPVFHIRHPHPLGTCFGTWASGVENGKEELMRHPNVFAMSGHSHINVGLDLGIWQGGFVSMGCGSARLVGPGTFGGAPDNTSKRQWMEGEFRHSPNVAGGGAWQGSVVSVYDDVVVVDRRDFRFNETDGEPIGEPWRVDFPFRHAPDAPYQVAAAGRAPQFAAGAKLRFSRVQGKRRPDNAKEDQLVVAVPTALSDGPYSRPVFYRVEVFAKTDGRKVIEREIIQDGMSNSESRTSSRATRCSFAMSELPASALLRFSVTPMNAARRAGRPMEGEFST